ncbi:hypothetical protein ACFC26_14725 [Kitasatospora purpeofusca]|uniref:hypothetical protein n=1 Tax=Kitasatospora purpeofusca TaxID=67352 RepID=UPI0035DE4776
MPYIDHATLDPADYVAFEQLLAADRDHRPRTDPNWELVFSTTSSNPGRQWESTRAVYRPTDPVFATTARGRRTHVQVYFDESGRALPDRSDEQRPDSPQAGRLAEHLPGWSVQSCRLNPGRDLAELLDKPWGWGPKPWTTTTAPHTALDVTGPTGEQLLLVQRSPGSPIVLGAAVPDGMVSAGPRRTPPPPPVTFSPDVDWASVADACRTLAPLYRRAAWLAHSNAVSHAVQALGHLTTARIADDGRAQRYWGDEGGFASEDARNRAAWQHIETALAAGPLVAAGIRAASVVEDYLDPALTADLGRLSVVENVLVRLREIRTGWQKATDAIVGHADEIEPVLRRSEALRNREAWPVARRLANSPLPALAAHVTPRIGMPADTRTEQAEAARARSGEHPAHPPSTTAAPPCTPPPGARHPAR